jgi:hypothetical protein
MPTKQPNQNQSQSGLEDDIKNPSTGFPRRGVDMEDDEAVTKTGNGLDDGDEALEEGDQPVRNVEGDDLEIDDGAELEDEAENDAGFDAGAKGQPR